MLRMLAFSVALTVSHPDAQACFEKLLALSGHGRLQTERAAFLVANGDAIDCVVWPATNTHRSANWRGALPANAFAIAHTHPLRSPNPSAHDSLEAERLGMPIFVVTPRRVVAVTPYLGRGTSAEAFHLP